MAPSQCTGAIRWGGRLGSVLRGIVLGLTVVAGLVRPAAGVVPEISGLIRELGFSDDAVSAVASGHIVNRTIGTTDPREIAVAGAVRVQAPVEYLIDSVRDIAHFKQGPHVLAIGRFSNPPTLDDLAGLTITSDDAKFRSCHVGACDIRLPAAIIHRFEHDIDWNAPDAEARAIELFKGVLVEDARAYLAGDPGRITEYDDGRRPIHPVADFEGLLQNSSYLSTLLPDLPAHLARFPSVPLKGAEDFLYWSKEKPGSASPFVSLTHITIAQTMSGMTIVTTKDVYSSRYIDASLGITLASDTTSEPHAFELVHVNRSRAQALRGGLGALSRGVIEQHVRHSLEDDLKTLKSRLEQ